jgi:REP element-mobilizing transposase RayT
MARPLRIEFADALYHVMARGNRQENIFKTVADRQHFVELLQEGIERYKVVIHGYVLMDNHVHLLVQTPKANLSRWMHWLLVSQTVWFNKRHQVVGHLFQGRFKSLLVESGEYLLELSRYMHLNPVRGPKRDAGPLAEKRKRLRDYPWSSYRAYAGLEASPGWLARHLVLGELTGGAGEAPESAYRKFVEQALSKDLPDPKQQALSQIALGSPEFLEEIKERHAEVRKQAEGGTAREVPGARVLERGDDPMEILNAIAVKAGIGVEELRKPGKRNFHAQNQAMVEIWNRCGLTLRELGDLFGGMHYQAVCQRIRRYRAQFKC